MKDENLKRILRFAITNDASDIHISAGKNIILRVDGSLVECDLSFSESDLQKIVDDILTDNMKQELDSTGDTDLSYYDDESGRFRINVHKQRNTPALAIRYVKSEILNFTELNLPLQLEKIVQKQRGIIFISGATGCGKSTTVASMIQYINDNYRKHIGTIEDPIEYEFTDNKSFIEQREVGFDTNSFNSAFIHSLRQDLDVILVGEMRNKESFDCAFRAADTGHLVLSTLHTTNSSQAIGRLLNLYPADEHQSIRHALANNLIAIITQRLVKGKGGKLIPAVEILQNNSLIKALLIEDRLDKLNNAIEKGKSEGMQSFNQSLISLVKEGTITEEEALTHASNPEALKMNLKGVYLSSDNGILG
ncbi:MAG: PilT/PilU family type 4a pilus ATPase [Victivallales bacterium]|nr:PilT/PilU family type 4a pilus ATPase [Victivallales bacterium]